MWPAQTPSLGTCPRSLQSRRGRRFKAMSHEGKGNAFPLSWEVFASLGFCHSLKCHKWPSIKQYFFFFDCTVSSPNSYAEGLTLVWLYLEMGLLRRHLRINEVISEGPNRTGVTGIGRRPAPSPGPHDETARGQVSKSREDRQQPRWHLDLRLLASRTVNKVNVCCLSSSVCGILLCSVSWLTQFCRRLVAGGYVPTFTPLRKPDACP